MEGSSSVGLSGQLHPLLSSAPLDPHCTAPGTPAEAHQSASASTPPAVALAARTGLYVHRETTSQAVHACHSHTTDARTTHLAEQRKSCKGA